MHPITFFFSSASECVVFQKSLPLCDRYPHLYLFTYLLCHTAIFTMTQGIITIFITTAGSAEVFLMIQVNEGVGIFFGSVKNFEFQVLATNSKYVSCPVGQTTWTMVSADPVPHLCLCPLTFARRKQETRELAQCGHCHVGRGNKIHKNTEVPVQPTWLDQEGPSHERGEMGGQADRCARWNRGRDGAEWAEVSGDRRGRLRGGGSCGGHGCFIGTVWPSVENIAAALNI